MSPQPTLRRVSPLRSTRRSRVTPRFSCSTVGQSFDITIDRVVDGWAVQIPEVGGVTHARRRATVELAARECIASLTGIPIGYVAVVVTSESD